MPRADSTIRVAIIGDVKGLSKALGTAEKDVQGLGGKMKGIAAGIGFGIAAKEVLDFASTALSEADRIGDAMTRLELQLGTDLAGAIDDVSGDFAKLGQSRQDILELAANFGDMATALGLGKDDIAAWADDVAATAAAIELLGGADAATNVDLIGKAAGGSLKAMKELGVFVDEAAVAQLAMKESGKDLPGQLTDTELAGARLSIIMEQLKPKLDAVATGTGDVERKQSELEARWETLTGQIGEGLEGPINDLLGTLIALVDWFTDLEEGMKDFQQTLKELLAPIGSVADALGNLLELAGQVVGSTFLGPGPLPGGGSRVSVPSNHAPHPGVTLNVVPRDSADTERAVINALRDYTARSGRLE